MLSRCSDPQPPAHPFAQHRAGAVNTQLVVVPASKGTTPPLFLPEYETASIPRAQVVELAYPDVSDAIFDVVGSQLTHLSLCDFSRLYHHRSSELVGLTWAAPVLSSSEVFSILKRLSLSRLTGLELVYVWDDAEEELLSYVMRACAPASFPVGTPSIPKDVPV